MTAMGGKQSIAPPAIPSRFFNSRTIGRVDQERQRGFAGMDRSARMFMFFSFAFINFVLMPGIGIKALGLVFLVLGIQQLVAKPNAS